MFNITHNHVSNILIIKDSENKVFGKIHLNDGASLQELTLNSHAIIQDLSPLTYDTTYASSILFPFANRVNNGAYRFNGNDFQLETNQKEEHNAMHGLVYNKKFTIVEKNTNDNSASITLEYIENNESIGFPFTYSIQLKYTFTKNNLSLNVSVKNTASKSLPFTLGWHPYFISDDLFKSVLNFDSSKKLLIGDRNITTDVEEVAPIKNFEIKDQKLDDCWILKSNKIKFNTPNYQLTIGSSSEHNFLQTYIPPRLNTIAIEPTTGVSDSFNNKIGLKILNANDTYSITWNLSINNN